MPGFSASRRFFRPIEPASVTATEAPVKVTETLDYAYGEEGKSQMEMPTVVPEPEVETVPEPKKKNTKKKKADN